MFSDKFCCRVLAFTLLLVAPISWAVDIQITTTDVPNRYTPGFTVTNEYEVVVSKATNTGTVTAIDVAIGFNGEADGISSMTWACTAPGGSTCSLAGGTTSSDGIAVTVDLADNNDVTFTITSVTYNASNTNDLDFDVAIVDPGMIGTNANVDGTSNNDTESNTVDIRDRTDITIDVSDGVGVYIPGAAAQYTINVTNSGPNSANNVEITDLALPVGLSISSWNCTAPGGGNSCSPGSGGSSLDTDLDLVNGGTASITVNGNFAADAQTNPLVYQVQARISDGTEYDPDGLVQIASDSNMRAPNADLVIDVDTQVTATTTYSPGDTEIYEVIVTNNGPSDVAGVTVIDNTISDNTIGEFTSISWTCVASSGSSCSDGTGSLNTTADLDNGDSATYTVTVVYDSAASLDPLNYAVTATHPVEVPAYSGFSPVTDNKSLSLVLFADLEVDLDDGEMTYVPGMGGTFIATVTNNGPSDVTGITVVDSDLSEISSISWTCSVSDAGSSCPAGPDITAVDTIIDLVAGDSAVFIIDVVYLSNANTNPLVYQVTATNPAGVIGDSPEVGTDNDDVLDRQVDITVTKASKVGSFVPNEPFDYTIVVSNNGPSDLGTPEVGAVLAENVLLLSDIIDGSLAEHPSECNGGTTVPCWKYCPSDLGMPGTSISPDSCPGVADISSGSGYLMEIPMHLSAGSSSEVKIFARVDESSGSNCDPLTAATREVCNTASAQITGSNTTHVGAQNSLTAFVSNEIVIGTDLIVTKTDNLTTASPGTEITYTIDVENDGFTDADGVTFSDVLPLFPVESAGFIPGSISWVCETEDENACCVSQTPSCGFDSPVMGTGNVLMTTIDLGGQSKVTYTVTGTISNEASGTISNTATATLPGGIDETDVSNNSDTDDTILDAEADVSVTKVLIGTPVTNLTTGVTDFEYEIVVTNNGPSIATNIDVDDLLGDPNINILTASWFCSIQGIGSCSQLGIVDDLPIATTVDLAVDSTATFNVTVSTNAFPTGGTVVNTVNVNFSTDGFDPVSINNSAVVEYSLSGTSRLRIDNDDFLGTATPGLQTNYTIKVQNEGPDNVFGATVENLFPPQLTDVEWTCSAISPIPGDLTFFQSSDQTTAGTTMLLSPDGSHIYIASPDTSRLYVFERNTIPGAEYGQITFIEFLTEGLDGITGIEFIEEFQMSRDGAYLYALSTEPSGTSSALAAFSRITNRLSPDYGRLSHLNTVTDQMPVNSVDFLLSPDDEHIYVTGDNEIFRYKRNTGDGLLSHQDSMPTSVAGHMVISSDGTNMYVVDEVTDQVDAYNRIVDGSGSDFGDLTLFGNVIQADIDVVADMLISGDDRSLYLTATGTDKLIVINRNLGDGTIAFAASYDDGINGFNFLAGETLVGMNHLAISPDGEHLFVSNPIPTDANDGSLLVLSRNSQGLLSKDQKISLEGMEGLSDMVVSPDGKQMLTTATDGKTLVAFDRRQPDPTFSFVEVEVDQQSDPLDPPGPGGMTGVVDGLLGASAVVVSQDGLHVYAASIGDNAIALFERDKSKGSTAATRGQHLTFIDSYKDGDSGNTVLADVNSLATSPNGEFVFAGSRDESTLSVFSRSPEGALTFLDSYPHAPGVTDGLLGVSAIVVDKNSQSLYVAAQFEASVAHYDIDGLGGLTLIGAIANGDVGVSGLGGANALALTPGDQDHLIVGSAIDDSVVVLSRSLASGEIVFQQHLPGVGDQPMEVAVSPDGEHVYVASANDSRLTVINRNNNPVSTEYGQLTINTSYVDGVGGFNHLLGLRSVVVSPNGEKVYVGAEFDAAVSVLDRDTNPNSASFGQLAVVEVQVDDVDGVNGLNQLYNLAVSQDSRHVYAVGFGDNALAAFVLGEGSSCSAQGSGNISDTVDIGSNGTLTYSVTGTIRPNAIGSIITEARVLPAENFTVDLPLDNCANFPTPAVDNCDQDTTNLVPITDLSISKSNGQLSAIAGEPIAYEIRVSNAGPSDANTSATERVMVKDILNDGFEPGSATWTCEAVGSGSLSFVEALIYDDEETSPIEGLRGVSDVAYAEDLAGFGPHVLATSVLNNSLSAFSVDVMTGQLTEVTIVTASPTISLNGARSVLVIDNDIYVASQFDDALVAFEAVDDSGNLDLQWQANFQFPAISTGLNQAVLVTASDNGSHVYVTGANDDAVVIFKRELGVLTYESTVQTTVPADTQGLGGVNAMAISADGYSAYTSGYNDNEIGRFQRDLVTGALTYVEVLNFPGVEFNAVSAIAISPDDQHVYITSAGNNRIYVFARDTSAPTASSDYGLLTAVQTIEQGVDGVNGLLVPSDVMISADGMHAYISSEQSDAVLWFARNAESGALVYGGLITDLVSSVDGLNGSIALASDDSGLYIYVAGSQDNGLAVLTRTADSSCPASGSGNVAGAGEAGVDVNLAVNGQLIFTVNATVAPDASGSLINKALILSCDLPLNPTLPVPPLDPLDPFDPLEDCVGSDSNPNNNSAVDIDTLNPTADLMISKTDGVSIYEGLTGAKQVTGDDQFIYVAAAQDNAVTMYKREVDSGDIDFGLLSYLGQRKNGEDGVSGLLSASDVILSADGQTLYASGSGDNSVVVFSKSSTGELTFVEKQTSGVFGVTGIEGVSALNLSTDGAHLYATGPLTNSLAVFEIDQSVGEDHGKLTFVQSLQNSVDGVSGLANASDVLISGDDMHVYVTSESAHSVSLFLRNPNDASVSFGQLSYQMTYTNGEFGIGGMLGAKKMVMDDNDEYLYILGSVDQALSVFNRDDTTGELAFIEFKQNGTSGVVGLNLARDLILSADQQSLYVAGRGENALVRFDRNPVDGILTFGDVIYDGDPLSQPGTFVNGLSGAAGLHMSDDDQHLYVVADQDSSISVFDRDNISPAPDLGVLSLSDVLINGRGGVAPGTELTYLIVASNAGPSDVENARVVDIFPPEFESISYQCFPVNGAGCTLSLQNGNVDEEVDLPVGSSILIRATGVIRSDASGVISNTATVMPSTNPLDTVSDPDISNNTATDDDTVLFVASDLVVTKDNGVTESIPGDLVSYTITVANNSLLPGNSIPSDVSDVMVTDLVPESISDVSWTCQAFPEPGLLDDGDGNPGTDNYLSFTELDQFNDMVIHPNGELAYVVGEDAGESTVLVYQRNSRSGDLVEIQSIGASNPAVNGLDGAQALALSPDNNQLYVVSNVEDSISTWSIDPGTGEITFEGVLIDGISGVNGLGGSNDVLVTADGLNVYVAGKADNAIAIFDRNIGSGQLTFNSFLTGVEGLSGVHALTQTGTYLVAVAEDNLSVATFTRSVQNGLLVPADVLQNFQVPDDALLFPRDVIVVNDQVLVASFGSGIDTGSVAIFSLDTDDGLLNFVNAIKQNDPGVTGLDGPESLVVSPSGRELYVASSNSEAIMLFAFNGDSYQPVSTIYDNALIPDLDGVNQLVMNASGTHLYAMSDELVLTEIQNGSSCTQSGQGALNDMADIVSMGYVEYTLSGTILPTASGILSNTATALMTGDSMELNPADNEATDEDILVPTSDLSVSKDDGLLEVVAGTSLEYDISVFSGGPSAMNVVIEDQLPIFPIVQAGFETDTSQWTCGTGRTLQQNGLYVEDGNNGLAAGNDVFESPDGQYVYVISGLGTLSVFDKDTSGVLTLVQLVNEADELTGGVVTGLTGARAATMDSQGKNIYIVSQVGNQLMILTRDEVSGEVDYQRTLLSGADGVFGMQEPVEVKVSSDGTGVYVAAFGSDAIAVFSRDKSDGDLTFVERVKDGFGTIVPESNVIIEITDLVISPNGEHLYAAADFSESISVFSRDTNTQELTFETVIRSGDLQGGLNVPDMAGPQSLVITNNGDFVYSVAQESSSLMRFKRSQTDGSLTFESVLLNGDVGVGSLESPSDLVLTPNGGRLLVTDQQNDFISIYDRNTNTGGLTLIDEFSINVSEDEDVAKPVSITTDGINVFVLLNQQDRLLAIRITADAECQLDTELTDTPLIPLYMSPGSAAEIQVSAHVHPSARGIINNTANIVLSPDSVDNNLANNSALDTTEIVVQTEVSITKTGPEDAVAGEFIAYQLILSNTGPSDALGVVVNDVMPAALLNASWTCSATGRSSCDNNSGSGNISESLNVTIDGEVTIDVTALIDPAFNGNMTNQADAVVFEVGLNTDTDLSNNSSVVLTTVTQVADLSVVKTNSTTEVVAGEATSYQIVFANAGPSEGQSVVLDLMPSGLEQISWQCSAGPGSSCTSMGQGDINETVYIAANSQLVYQIDALVSSSAIGQLFNKAMIDSVSPVFDPELSNNLSSDVDEIIQVADLSVSLDDLIDPYDPASPIDLPFALQVVNMGPSDATNVQVNLPLQLDVTADTVNVCSVSASGVNCDIGYSTAGEVHEFIVNYRLNPALTGDINNLAEATSDTFDPDLGNNTDSTVTTLASGVDVRVMQTNGLEEVEPGQSMTYEIVVENIGSFDAGEVTIDEQLPAGLINASWQCVAFEGASCINIDEFGVTGGADLPAGGRVLLTLSVTVDPALSDMSQTQIDNTVEAVLVNETDYNMLNNSSTLSTPLVFFIFKDGFEGVTP